jgi:hypothetical protein
MIQCVNRHYKGEKNMDHRAVLCLFIRTLPIEFALLGRKLKYVHTCEIKDYSKVKKQTNLDRRAVQTNSYHVKPSRPPFFFVTDYL